jgi:hypothetical protein
MQQHGSGKNPRVAAFFRMDAHGIPEDAQNMGKIVRAVVAVGRMRNQRRRKRFVWGEGFSREHSATCHEEDRFPPIGHRRGIECGR